MALTVQDFCGNRLEIVPAEGDTTVTIADLAQFVTFDSQAARAKGDPEHKAAYHALRDHYAKHEMQAGGYHPETGFWVVFKDGSSIRYNHN